jgi:phosphoglycerate dehydrogenase-like enzyme
MAELVAECSGLIVGVDAVTAEVLDAGPLLAVVKYGSGTDNIDLKAAASRSIPIVKTGAANAASVAELTIGLILALARGITTMDRRVRSGSWSRIIGVEIAGRTIGIVGYGKIGQEVGQRATALGMNVVAHDPDLTQADVPLLDLDELLESSDIVSLHVPLMPATEGLIDAARIARMRPGGFLVNAARGGIVDEEAVADALETGHLAGAALDSFSHEPLPASSRLRDIDSVILTPHCGAATVEATVRAGTMAVELLVKALSGQSTERNAAMNAADLAVIASVSPRSISPTSATLDPA